MEGEELALVVMLKVLVEEETVVKMLLKGEGLMEQTAWRLEGPFPEFTCFQTKIEIVSV